MTYLVITLIFLYFTFIHDEKGIRRNYNKHLKLCFILLVLLAGCRYYIGVDTYQYRAFYENLSPIHELTEKELLNYRYNIGWVLYCSLLKYISSDFIIVQFVNAIILNYGVYLNIKRYAKYKFITLCLYSFTIYYIHINFEYMREAVAVGIFLTWGIEAMAKKKYLQYYIICLTSSLFHTSAIIVFLIPLFKYLYEQNHKIILTASIFIIPFTAFIIHEILSTILGSSNYIVWYLQKSLYGDIIEKDFIYYLTVFYVPIIYIFIIFLSHRSKLFILYPYLLYFGFFCFSMNVINYTASRYVNYIFPFFIILSSNYIGFKCKHYLIKAVIIYILIFNSINLFIQYKEKPQIYYPYRYYFEGLSNEQKKIKNERWEYDERNRYQ